MYLEAATNGWSMKGSIGVFRPYSDSAALMRCKGRSMRRGKFLFRHCVFTMFTREYCILRVQEEPNIGDVPRDLEIPPITLNN